MNMKHEYKLEVTLPESDNEDLICSLVDSGLKARVIRSLINIYLLFSEGNLRH
jgi:hypothetical protein